MARVAGDDAKRPLLDAPDAARRVQTLLQQRTAAYARFRPVTTDGRAPEQVAGDIAAALAGGLRDVLPVRSPDGGYDVIVGDGLLAEALTLAGINGPVAVITDSEVGPRHAATFQKKPGFSEKPGFYTMLTMPAGERHKTLDTVRDLYDGLLSAGLDRTGTIIALGGGVVGDVAGFVAATYLRGVEFVLCPTSLLAMVDASIGGKTGVDMPQGKNLVGAFKQPRAVLADVGTLATLPAAEFTAGLAEVAKHGLIADPLLWQRLMMEEWHFDPRALATDRLRRADLQSLLARAIRVKRDVVEADPYERGRRAVLNLGHTFGHAIETGLGYGAWLHGEAVAAGTVMAAQLSHRLGWLGGDDLGRLIALLRRAGLPVAGPPLGSERYVELMSLDKKVEGGQLRLVLLQAIGRAVVSSAAGPGDIRAVIDACSTHG